MDGLDLSGLSEDQLVVLVRAALREIASRDEALVMAAENAIVDERERHDIALAAARAEAAAQRERERVRIMELARALTRAQLERQMDAVEAARAHAAEAAAAAHMGAALLDARERARVADVAAQAEAAAERARERSRIAAEAERRMRDALAAENADTNAAREDAAADRARSRAKLREAGEMDILREASEIVGRAPDAITLLLVNTPYGRRLLINPGEDRWTRDHLADVGLNEHRPIRTKRDLIRRKSDLAAFAARLAARHPDNLVLIGAHYSWTPTEAHA